MFKLRRILPLAGVLIAAVSACLLPFAQGQSGKKPAASKTAKPPKWEKRVVDAFFADALKHVGPGKPGGMVAGPGGGNPAVAANSGAANPGGAASTGVAPVGGFAWSKLIDSDVLESEIKANINILTPAVAIPGNFKSQTYKKARTTLSELAVLFGVVGEFDGDVKWKSKAAGLRDVLAKAGANCKVGTEQSFKEAKQRSEDLKDLLDGGGVDVPAAEPKAEWAKVADRPELMKRMEEAGLLHLTPWTANAGEFNSNKAKILHEAQVLALFAQVIQHGSFAFADDENYLKHAAALQKACLEIADGAKSGNADKARTGASDMAKACANCHADFK